MREPKGFVKRERSSNDETKEGSSWTGVSTKSLLHKVSQVFEIPWLYLEILKGMPSVSENQVSHT